MKNFKSQRSTVGCFIVVVLYGIFLSIGFVIGSGLFTYAIWNIFEKDPGFLIAGIAGLVSSPVLIPVCIFVLVAKACGVHTPFIH
jgi:hypothetical protein